MEASQEFLEFQGRVLEEFKKNKYSFQKKYSCENSLFQGKVLEEFLEKKFLFDNPSLEILLFKTSKYLDNMETRTTLFCLPVNGISSTEKELFLIDRISEEYADFISELKDIIGMDCVFTCIIGDIY